MATSTASLARPSLPARPRLQLIPGGIAGVRPGAAPADARPWAAPASTRSRRSHPAGRGPSGPAGGGTVRTPALVPVWAVPAPRRRGAPGRPGLRLTRWGRIVLRLGGLLLAVLTALVLVLVLTHPAAAGGQRHPVPARYHVVLPGETLWGIAGQIAPNADRREVIAEIVELNALPGSGVAAGQRIALPPTP